MLFFEQLQDIYVHDVLIMCCILHKYKAPQMAEIKQPREGKGRFDEVDFFFLSSCLRTIKARTMSVLCTS